MTTATPITHPNATARAVGAMLIAMAGVAIFAQLGVRAALVIPGDAAETYAQLRAHPTLFRLGLLGLLTAFLLDVPVAVLLHSLTRASGPMLSTVAMSFRLVYTAAVVAALLPWLVAIALTSGDVSLSAVAPVAIEQATLFCMALFDAGFGLSLVFFGLHLMLLAPLLSRSGAVPRALAAVIGLGGFAYAADFVGRLLFPSLQPILLAAVGTLGMGELVLAVWLLVRGWQPAEATGTAGRLATSE